MATIRFNLHEALAETKIQEAIDLAPSLAEPIEELRASGMSAKEIVEYIAGVMLMIEREFPSIQRH